MPELTGAGAGAPVHGPAEDEPGTESRTEIQIGEGPSLALDGQPERGRVGVLVHDDRHPEPPRERVPQREAVPLGESRHPVQNTAGVVERTGQGDTGTEEGPGAQAARHRAHQRVRLSRDRRHHGLRPRPQVQRGTPLPHHGTREIDQHRP